MSTCQTCKHWKRQEEFETGHHLGLGQCENIPMFWNATEWDEDGEGRKFSDCHKDTKAFVQDGSDYWACLLTKPDFGCVSYQLP